MGTPELKSSRISVIIPTLNEAEIVGTTVTGAVRLVGRLEVIVADGGSRDETAAVATQHGAIVITSRRGRGTQMHAGAIAATGDILWFLHADTLPTTDAPRQIAEALMDQQTVGGNFQIRFAGEFASARFLTWLYRQLARLGLQYGDSGY